MHVLWILSIILGSVVICLSGLRWMQSRQPADGLFGAVNLFLLLHCLSYFSNIAGRSGDGVHSTLFLTSIMLTLILLPQYLRARIEKPTAGILSFVNTIVVVLLVSVLLHLRTDERAVQYLRLFRIFQIYTSIISLTVIIVLMRTPAQSLRDIPPKPYQVSGILALVSAASISFPAVLQFWGLDLHLPQENLFFLLYIFLSLRFLSFLLPSILVLLQGKEIRRESRYHKYGITPREREVYDLVAKAYSYREIANLLSISLPTVKTHIEHLFSKTRTNSKIELITLIDEPDSQA